VNGWSDAALGDVFEIARGGSPRPIDEFITDDPTGINWIMIGDASEGSKYITETKKRIRPEGVQRSRRVKSGDFLLTNSMSFGKPYIMRTSGCIHDGWLVLSPRRDDVDADFFYYLLGSKAVYAEFERRASGLTVKNLNIELVKGVKVSFPPLSEQRRIAEVLDRAEALRAKRRAALAQLDSLTQSIFLDFFGPNGKHYLSCSTASLGSLCRSINDGVHKTPTYIENGVPFVTVKNIVSGALDLAGTKFISEDDHRAFTKRTMPERGDVLVSKDGTIGVPCPIMTDEEFSIFVSVALIKPKKDLIDQSFLVAQFQSDWVQRQIRAESKGIAIRHLHLEDFKRLVFVAPPIGLQREFARRVQAVEKLKTAQRASLAELDALFASLQHRAFRGEL